MQLFFVDGPMQNEILFVDSVYDTYRIPVLEDLPVRAFDSNSEPFLSIKEIIYECFYRTENVAFLRLKK